MEADEAKPRWSPEINETYVGFLDVLGFSKLIEDGFESALDAYKELLSRLEIFGGIHEGVTLQIYSDSLLVTSSELIPLAQAIQNLNFLTLTADCLVRGGVAFGLHAAEVHGSDTLVVSQALSRAAETEKSVGHPCVALHDSVNLEDWVWLNEEDTFVRPILYFEGVRLVNPFSLFWGSSAKYRVGQMLARYPEHAPKYDWFLRLFEAVWSRDICSLVPPEYVPFYEPLTTGDFPNA